MEPFRRPGFQHGQSGPVGDPVHTRFEVRGRPENPFIHQWGDADPGSGPVEAEEDVIVPAGTLRALRCALRTRRSESVLWIAPGVGIVRETQGIPGMRPGIEGLAELRPDGLVGITLKKAYADGTIAIAWTCCRCCVGSPPACPHRAGTPSATRECAEKLAVVQEADPQHRESPA